MVELNLKDFFGVRQPKTEEELRNENEAKVNLYFDKFKFCTLPMAKMDLYQKFLNAYAYNN